MKKLLLTLFLILLFTSKSFSLALYEPDPTDIFAESQKELKANFAGLTAGTADTAGTGLDTFQVGDGGDTNKSITAGNDDGNKPYVRYVATQDAWALSNEGSYDNYFVVVSADTGVPLKPKQANSVWVESNKLCWEGSTADAFKTCIDVTDPTVTNLITLANSSFSLTGSISAKVGEFTRDTTAASGTQAVTGVGFSPKALIFFAAEGAADEMSFGIDDGTSASSVADDSGNAAGTYTVSATLSIRDRESSTLVYEGEVTTLGSDGFTITWTRTSTPSGTLAVEYLAIR